MNGLGFDSVGGRLLWDASTYPWSVLPLLKITMEELGIASVLSVYSSFVSDIAALRPCSCANLVVCHVGLLRLAFLLSSGDEEVPVLSLKN